MISIPRSIESWEPNDADARSAPTKAEINLGHLVHNLNVFRRKAPTAEVMAVVKADAYGHGAPRVAAALSDAGVNWFAVATVPEGIRLRKSGIDARILVLAAPLREYVAFYPEYDLDITVSSEEVAGYVLDAGRGPFRVHVKIETGMNRIGIPCKDAVRVVRRMEASGHVQIEGLWTHLATADDHDLEFSRRQIRQFYDAIKPLEDVAAHIHTANSAAALRLGQSVQIPRAIMRVGIGLYGYSSLRGLAEDAGLSPIMRLTSRITHVKPVAPGASVSYGRRWTAKDPTQIATVGAGYADGLPRLLSNRGEVTIGNRQYPIVGTVCMDMFMVDVGVAPHVSVGDEVVLFGPEGPDAFQVAVWAETIPYEILTGVAARVPRLFVS